MFLFFHYHQRSAAIPAIILIEVWIIFWEKTCPSVPCLYFINISQKLSCLQLDMIYIQLFKLSFWLIY